MPFDLRTTVDDSTAECFARQELDLLVAPPWNEKLMGYRPSVYEGKQDHFVAVSKHGLGLNIRREKHQIGSLGDHDDVARVIVARDRHHRAIQNDSHGDVGLIRNLRSDLLQVVDRRRVRPEVWAKSPYTFSFFYIPASASSAIQSDEERRGLFALLEPSQVRRRESASPADEVPECARLIRDLSLRNLEENYRDSDVKVGSYVLCSWAGVVAFDEHCCDMEYFESLEIRLQMSWMHANFIRQWAELSLTENELEPAKLSKIATDVRPIMRQAKRVIDGTASSRDQQLFDEMVRTSDLAREIEGAEQAVSDVQEQIEVAQSATRRRYDLTVETLLLLLAALQIVPIVMKVPVAEVSAWWLLSIAVVLVAFVVFRFRSSR